MEEDIQYLPLASIGTYMGTPTHTNTHACPYIYHTHI